MAGVIIVIPEAANIGVTTKGTTPLKKENLVIEKNMTAKSNHPRPPPSIIDSGTLILGKNVATEVQKTRNSSWDAVATMNRTRLTTTTVLRAVLPVLLPSDGKPRRRVAQKHCLLVGKKKSKSNTDRRTKAATDHHATAPVATLVKLPVVGNQHWNALVQKFQHAIFRLARAPHS